MGGREVGRGREGGREGREGRNNVSQCLRRTMVRIASDVTWDSRNHK